MLIDTDHLEGWTGYAAGLIRLAEQEQSKHVAKQQKREAAKVAATVAAALLKEHNETPPTPGLSEIDRLTREVERLDLAIDKAGIDRSVKVSGDGLRSYHPLVAMLRQARFRLKQATDARDRVLAATGSTLFGRSL